MLYSFRKLRNDYLKSVETKDFDKCFQDHTQILLQNKKDLYAAQRTILYLRHRMFMGFELKNPSSIPDYYFGKFKVDNGGSLKPAPDNIKTGLHFLKDGGIMDGTFHANGDLKTGVYYHLLYGVVEEGTFQNNILIKGVRLCQNGNFEEGTFVDGKFTTGLRHRADGSIEEGTFSDGELIINKF